MEPHPHSPHAVLSARQLEVATLVAAGNSTREIAQRLSLSPRTVETHLSAIFEKLSIRTRGQLIAIINADAWQSLRLGNIPAALPALIGRHSELSTLSGLLAKHRLVTIVGAGGIGKTQTALRVVTDAHLAYPDGVWLVDLLAFSSGEFVAADIARLMNVTLPPSDDALAQLMPHLKSRRALLVFDNCEHLIENAATLVATILRDCSRIAIVATSREPLGITGEITFGLPPLDEESAQKLFVARARAVDDRFTVDDDCATSVRELCRKLDRIPLAIELAAARSNIFSPRELLARLEHRFALLEDGKRDATPRHQSMRAVIDWSYDLLDERDRRLFRRLSIFTGPFSLEAALAISGYAHEGEATLVERLFSLINKSLVVADAGNEELPYRLLESTRIYARLKLEESGEAHEVALCHVRFFRDTLVAITEQAKRWMSQDAVAFFRRELNEIRSALAWARRSDEVAEGAELLAATHFLWSITSIREGISLTDDYLAALGPSDATVRAKLLSRVSELHWRNGNQERSVEAGMKAVDVARESGDEPTLGEALVASAVHSIMHDREYSIERLCEAEALANVTQVTRDECLHLRARLTYVSDDYERAIPLYRDLNEAAKRANDVAAQAECTMVLAIIEYRAGRYDRAVRLGREGVAVVRDGNEPWALALSTSTLAGFLARTGALDEARDAARESLRLYAEIDPESPRIGTALEIIGYAFAVDGELARAAQLQGRARAIASKPNTVQSRLPSDIPERYERLLRDALTDEELATLYARGATLGVDELLSLATPGESRGTSGA